MNKCVGCGIILQNKDKDKLGYTKNLDNKYCERCFKTIHYNEERKINDFDNDNVIVKINKLNYFTIFITDLINLNMEVIECFKKIKNNKVLVVNKCDLIPNNLKLEHIENNIKDSYNINEDVFFISAKKNYNLGRIKNLIEDNEKVIICGETSSGKSTLINNITGSKLTISKYNNTTLDFIKIKYNNSFIYDTPGIIFKNSSDSENNIIILTKSSKYKYEFIINDYKFSLNGNLTFIINDKNKLKSKKSDTRLEKEIEVDNNSDLLIKGVGFIYIKNKTKLKINKNIEIRKSIIGR